MSNKEEKKVPEHKKLLKIIDEYLVDLECLREMRTSVIPVLEDKDKERAQTIAKAMKVARVENSEGDEVVESKATDEEESSEEKKNNVKYNFLPRDYEFLMTNLRKINKAQELFEKQLIVTLVSRYDEFLGSLLKLVLEKNPSWLISSEKTITYKELIDLKSIDKAIEGVILKEVDKLLRDSHEDHISYIDDKLKLGIATNFDNLPDFLEIAERRNLFVHTGGVVSNQYIDSCNKFGYEVKDVKCDDHLASSTEYFENAFLVYFEIGLRIAQAAYRRLFPNDLEIADQSLNNSAIKFMNAGEYNLAEVITNFDLSIPEKLRKKDTENLYFAHINQAIAKKFQGKEFEKGLAGIPWNVFHPKYSLSLHVLREEFDEAGKLMKSEEIKSSISKDSFRTWPVFRDFRGSEQFQEAYKENYGEDYKPDLKKDMKLKREQENKALETES
jgi:hypothetical protein